jgi:hypothetical protein
MKTSRKSGAPSQDVCTKPAGSALEQVQLTFATQLDDSLEVLLAIALLALRPLPEIAIGRLPVAWSSRHV